MPCRVGVSLTGNQVGEPCGSLATNAPSSVGMNPSSEPSGSMTGLACPPYVTTTVNDAPLRNRGRRGDDEFLHEGRGCCHVAARPSTTVTELTCMLRRRSRSKRDRSCVATALMRAVPDECSVDGVNPTRSR